MHTLKETTVTEAVNNYLDHLEKRGTSYHHLRTVTGHLKRFARAHGTVPVDKVNRSHIEAHLQKYDQPKTFRNHLGSLRALFEWAKDVEMLPDELRNVASRVHPPKLQVIDPEFYSPEEMRRLLLTAAREPRECGWVAALVVLSGFVGMRCEEVLRINWGSVDLDSKVVRLSSSITKTMRRRIALIPDNALEWLKPLKELGQIVPPNMARNAHRATGEVSKKAGVKWKHNGLRHSYITYAMAGARNVHEVCEQVGNTPSVLQTSYKGLALPAEAAEWFNISPSNTL